MAKEKFPKPVRIINLNLIKKVRQFPCRACDIPGPSQAHHIQTRGAGGPDTLDNLMPLCSNCHHMVHRMGIRDFAKRFNLQINFDTGYPRLTLDQ